MKCAVGLALFLLITVSQWKPYSAKSGKKDDVCHKNAGSKECSSKSSRTEKYQTLVPGMQQGEKLTKFLDRVIRPSSTFNKLSREIIDKVVRSLQQNLPGAFKSRIKRIVKSGSLGKGTHVKEKSDIDLIIFFNGYNSVQELQAGKKEILQRLKDFIEKDWSDHLRYKAMTPFSVQFYLKIKEDDHEHEVDLLPALDITQSGRRLSDIYDEMKGMKGEDRGAYSSSLGPLQLEFVTATDRKSTPGKVKDVIRLLKYWAKEEDVPVRGYFLELLSVRLWRLGGKPNDIDMEDYLHQILQQLVDLNKMAIAFDDNYNYKDYVPQQKKPFLLDPANPFRNVAPTRNDINTVIEKAKDLLERMR